LHPTIEKLKNQKELLTPLLIVSSHNTELLEETKALCHTFLKRKAIDHPDLLVFHPEQGSKTYAMDTVRSLIQEANLPPYEEKFRYFVLDRVETMLTVHQNALLKVLEEHPPFTKFILLANSTAPLLPTVLSRLKKIFLHQENGPRSLFPDFSLPFSHLHQNLQNSLESTSFVDFDRGEKVLHQLSEDSLRWTLEGQRAEELHIRKKNILEAFYAKFKTQGEN
jgi:hypothetical protein